MYHSFQTEIAQLYGVDEAIMIENLAFWIRKNEANGKFNYDGRYWTYNSAEAFKQLFPYWSAGQVRRIIQSLIKQDVILTGNYNQSAYDRTMWYAFTDSFYSILRKLNLHLLKSQNGDCETEKPIPDINININKDIDNTTTLFPDAPVEKKERKTLFANSDFCKEHITPEGTLKDPEAIQKIFSPDNSVNAGRYFFAVYNWSDKSDTKRTNRGWIATIREWIAKDKEKGVTSKAKQEDSMAALQRQIEYMTNHNL